MSSMSLDFFSKFFTTGARRDPASWAGKLLKPFAALVALGIVWVTTIQIVQIYAMTIVFLGLMLALVFLTTGATAASSRERVPLCDLLFAAASMGISAYFWFHNERIVTRITLLDELTLWDIICGSGLLLITLEATRRTVGPGLTTIVLVFLGYNLWGDRLPGVLGHGSIDYLHFLDILAFTTDGIFGAPIRVALTYVFLFGLFGTFLSRTGGGDFFFDAASAVSGKSPGGPAKIAVVSSGLYGTISGSPTADVVTTGSITIPMMKKLGYSGALAGGIEVAASTGGSILPPVMGSAAFIMAEFTGIRYTDIALAGILPAFLYYFCVYLQVHLNSLKLGIAGLDKVPAFGDTMRRGGMFLVPLIALVVALLIGYSPNFVAAFGTLAVIAVAMYKRETRLSFKGFYEILAEATLRVVPVVAACAAAGLVVGGLSMTGLGAKVTELIFLLAGTDLFLSLVVAAVITLVLGMGMPTPSVYILAAVLVAPALTKLGVSLIAAHLFLVYYASLSAMTPPIAVAAFAAAPIALANPLAVGLAAVRMAMIAFVVPFAFVYNNGILLSGAPLQIAFACLAVILAVACLCLAAEGFWKRPLGIVQRLCFLVAGLGLLTPSPQVQVAGGIAAVFGAWMAIRVSSGVDDRHGTSTP
ncbi:MULTISPECIES: TRAP transporter permease [Aromatoleum]|nr:MULTISPECIES: TRAP transporter fused permease subunit [Aromatoleum]MCK0509537.1 TRAP transporter fused permease subunit [Aromatoleum buckelii]